MTAWLDFIFCAMLGWTGIHKFKERKVILGAIYFLSLGFCGIGWIADTVKYLIIAIKRTREICNAWSKRLPENAVLPVIEEPELLKKRIGEICHYEQNAACISPKSVKNDDRNGLTAVFGLQMTATLNPRNTKRINWRKTDELLGRLYVTNQRVLITDGQGEVECPIDKIESAILYRNLIVLKKGEKRVFLATDEAAYVYQIAAQVRRRLC